MRKLSLAALLGVCILIGMFSASVEPSITATPVVEDAEALMNFDVGADPGKACWACAGEACVRISMGTGSDYCRELTVYRPDGTASTECDLDETNKCTVGDFFWGGFGVRQ